MLSFARWRHFYYIVDENRAVRPRCVQDEKPLKCGNKCSAVAEMGDRLATTHMGRKLGTVSDCALCWGELGPHLTECGLRCSLPPYQVAS